jgi:NAD(P)-dependent dehydrogenase (short-subunit alcohol dehydrogenase family)
MAERRRVALVSNVNHFVGLAAAQVLASDGARVVCHDAAFADADARTRFAADNPGLEAAAEQEPAAVVAAALDAGGGRLNALVANEAYPAIRAPVEAAKLDDLRAGLEALVVRPFALIAAAVPAMKRQGSGSIVLVTSAAPLRGLPNYSMYTAARGGANALAVSLARELARYGVRVNAVAPNYVESPSYFPPELLADEAARAKILANVPLGRLGTPEEVGALIAFLASDRCGFITGRVLPVDGGWA